MFLSIGALHPGAYKRRGVEPSKDLSDAEGVNAAMGADEGGAESARRRALGTPLDGGNSNSLPTSGLSLDTGPAQATCIPSPGGKL